jgi:predicted nucleotidyltransferase
MQLKDRYLTLISLLAANTFKNLDYKLYLYGSRARDDAKFYSDVDLAIEFAQTVSSQARASSLGNFAEALEESTLPYFVDLIDIELADAALRTEIDRIKIAI